VPGQVGAAARQAGLVGLNDQQVVRVLDGHEELGGVGVGVQRVSGDHGAGQVQADQQRPGR
jgi:hypothetical protein